MAPKQSETNHASKLWSYLSRIFVYNIKEDYIFCESCMLLITYKHATSTGGMQKHIASCSRKSCSVDELNERCQKYEIVCVGDNLNAVNLVIEYVIIQVSVTTRDRLPVTVTATVTGRDRSRRTPVTTQKIFKCKPMTRKYKCMHWQLIQLYKSLFIYSTQQTRRADDMRVILNEQRRDDAKSQLFKKSSD